MERTHVVLDSLLDPLVERIWTWRTSGRERIAMPLLGPGVGAELMVHLGRPLAGPGRPLPRIMLWHLGEAPLDLEPQEDLHFVSLRIRAGALRHLVPDLGSLGEGVLDAEAIWPALGALRERVGDLPFAAQAAALQAWLRGQRETGFKPDPSAQRAIDRLYQDPGPGILDRLCAETGLGPRQLQRRFKAAVGLSPKAFQQRSRLYRIVRACVLEPGRRSLDAALEQAFFDQSHFDHAFRQATGWQPESFLREARSRTHFYNPPRRGLA